MIDEPIPTDTPPFEGDGGEQTDAAKPKRGRKPKSSVSPGLATDGLEGDGIPDLQPVATTPPLPEWNCHIPNDPTCPRRKVAAQTAGDAMEVYKRELGILVAGHPIQAIPLGASP